MIVGAISGNAMGMVRAKGDLLTHEFSNANRRNAMLEEAYGKNSTYTSKVAIENLMMANRVALAKKEEQESEKNNDFTSAQQARATMLFANFQRANNLQYLDEHKDQLLNQIDLLDDKTLAEQQGIPIEKVQDLKDLMKSELEEQYKRYKRLSDFAKYTIGNKVRDKELSKEEIAVAQQALAYELFQGENSFDHADAMLNNYKKEVQDLVGFEDYKGLDIKDAINKSTRKTQSEIGKTQANLFITRQKIKDIDKQQRDLESTAQSAITPEGRQSALSSLNSLTNQRNELTNKEIELVKQFNTLLNTDRLNPKSIQISSADELSDLQEQLKNSFTTIDNLEPEKAERLKTYLKEYEKSVASYKRYQERVAQMSKLDFDGRNPLGKILNWTVKSEQNIKDVIKAMMDTHFVDEMNDTLKSTFEKKVAKEKEVREEKPVGVSIKDLISNINETKIKELEDKLLQLESETSQDIVTNIEEALTSNQKDNLEKAKKGEKKEKSEAIFTDINTLLKYANTLVGKTFNVNNMTVTFETFRDSVINGAGGRVFIKVNIDGVPVTFYSSTGSGNKSLQEGIFYPTLGVEADERYNGRWINKVDSEQMASYYNSPALAIVGNFLDTNFGNLNNFADELSQRTVDLQNPEKKQLTKEEAFDLRKEFIGEYLNSGRETFSQTEKDNVVNAFENLKKELDRSKVTKYEDNSSEILKIKEEIAKEKSKSIKSSNLSDYIQAILNENPYLLERIDGQSDENIPTENEMEEFVDLVSKYFKGNNQNELKLDSFEEYLNEEDSERLKELNDKLVNWEFLQTANYEGITLADLMKQRAALNQPVETKPTENILQEEDLEKLEDSEETVKRFDILQTVKDVFVKQENGSVIISHMSPKKWLELQGQNVITLTKKGAKKSIKTTLDKINDLVEAGDLITYGNTTIKYVKGAQLVVPKSVFNLESFKTGSGYSVVFDNEGKIMESDFEDAVEYSSDEIFKLKNGDELTLVVDLDDKYNKSLEKKSEDEIKANLKITFEFQGQKVADLKANHSSENPDASFLAIREKAYEAYLNATNTGKVEIATTKVQTIFLGAPKLELDFETRKIRKHRVTNPNLILDYGYWNGKKAVLKSGDNEGIRTELLKNLKNKEVPVVVLQEGNTKFIYPANLIETESGLGDEIMKRNLSENDLAIALNLEARKNGINSELFYISSENNNMFEADQNTSQELEQVVASLNAVKNRVDYKNEWMKPSHSQNDLINQIELTVNPESKMLTSPKIVIYPQYSEIAPKDETATEMTKQIQKALNIRERISRKVTKFAKPLGDNLYVKDGATYRYVEIDGEIYSMYASNETFKKMVDRYLKSTPGGEENNHWKEKIKNTKSQKENIFGEYESYLQELNDLEDKINSDFLLKHEYDKLLTLSDELKKEAEKNKKCGK
jgi:hypothetical protein